MKTVDLTFLRAFKFWWSLTWRTLVISFPIYVIGMYRVFVWIAPFPTRADPQPHVPLSTLHSPHFLAVLWPIVTIVSIIIQIVAVRWALTTRWSDFRLQAVTEDQAPAA
jgi:magnesium-transporting ATPase (P-type)